MNIAVRHYEAAWPSLDSRPIPGWYDDAKLGIFVHWGIYSVPSWGPKRNTVHTSGEAYAEWYGSAMQIEHGPYWSFHRQQYGERCRYEDFAQHFKAELFDPEQWASLFARSGARFVTLTSKHHDGFCLWPSEHSWNWNTVDIGPHRDLVGELAAATRAQGLRMGVYYSLLEWYNPLYLKDPARYAREKMIPQMKDLVERYAPSMLFTDGEWEHSSEVWHAREFLQWLFNESPVRDEIVVNDRWGKETRSRHGGYYTIEYGEVDNQGTPLDRSRKWEENRSIGSSYGYNRNERLEDYLSEDEVIHLLANTVSNGGNLLLNVGPTADGRIPVIMEERLLQLGDWLKVNGEAIYGTSPVRAVQGPDYARFTGKENRLYIICLRWPQQRFQLEAQLPAGCTPETLEARMLGTPVPIGVHRTGERQLAIEVPALTVDELPCRSAYTIEVRW